VSDTVIPLLSRRRERALVVQKLPHVLGAVGLLVDGLLRVQHPQETYGMAVGAAELLTSALVLGAFLWSLATTRARTDGAHAHEPHGVDWVDLLLGAMFAVEAVAHHYETNHWSRPTILLAVTMVAVGLLHGPIVARARRRRGLQITNKGLTIGQGLRRFSAEWSDLKPIAVSERWGVLESASGTQYKIDLGDLGNEQQVRDALREAEILRTAKRRFIEKAPPASNPDTTLYIRPVPPKPAPISAPAPAPAPVAGIAAPSEPTQLIVPVPAAAPAPAPAPVRRITRPPTLITRPTIIQAAGNKPKKIEEYAGRVNSGHQAVSVARMVSPEGWVEPGQQPEFEEITIVLRGLLRVEFKGGAIDVRAGQAIVSHPGEWIRYSSPEPGGAEYVAICLPAFSPATVHRDDA